MTDQPLVSITAAQSITIASLGEANGISIENGDEVTFEYEGTYSMTFSIQITNLANSVQKAVFWVKKNGVDYPDSATEIDLQPRKSSSVPNRQVITINYVATAEAGDYVQVFWAGDSTELTVESLPAGTSPVYPAVPSIILTAVQVMYTQLGPEGPQGPAGESGSSLIVSDTAPETSEEGQQWYNSLNGKIYIYYDSFWVETNPSNVGPQGPMGETGPQGEQGIQGPEGPTGPAGETGPIGDTGVVAAVSPITYNSGTKTIGIEAEALNAKANLSGAAFTGSVSATSFSGAGTGLTGTASGLTVNALGGGTNISTYVNMANVSANTNTKVANLILADGMYAFYIHWDAGFGADGVSNHYWSSSYSAIAGITSASAGGYFNGSPQQPLIISGTQHHRTVNVPTFLMYSDSTNGSYGNLSLYINTPVLTRFQNFQVILKRLF
jgi:hypothetical protein